MSIGATLLRNSPGWSSFASDEAMGGCEPRHAGVSRFSGTGGAELRDQELDAIGVAARA